MKRLLAITAALAAFCITLDAYTFMGSRWPDGTVTMQLQLGSSGTLLDGSSSWGVSAEDALATWNRYVSRVQFRVVRDSTAALGSGNSLNNVFFSSTQYGQAFGSSTLAVTLTRYFVSSGQTVEADVVFNTGFSWNSYSGSLRSASSGGTLIDFHRVALHEFGHVLGLDHPDQAGQSVSAIMNSRVSNTDALQSDDVAGAQVLYGGASAPSTPPGSPTGLITSSSGTTVFLSWNAPSSGGAPTAYMIEAGSAAGLANLANFSTGNTATSFSSGGVGAGNYYVRVRARNAAGTSSTSNESLLVVGGGGGGCSTPPAPGNFQLTFNNGGTVSFAWAASAGATSYVIEAGSLPGAANLANSDLGSPATSATFSGVGAGTYYVRLRAKSGCGQVSGASNEVVLIIGTGGGGGSISETFTGALTGGEAVTCSDSIVTRPCKVIPFTVSGSGTLSASMSWAESPDIDLSLWKGSTFVNGSRGTTNGESFSAAVTPGAYEYHVTYYEGPGTANYTIRVTRPQ
jgi:matrixin